uniref:Uncharacterized protein n=1 Tax=Aegilops tauschii TaxID=37682 RepID=R7W0Z5_AEGTA
MAEEHLAGGEWGGGMAGAAAVFGKTRRKLEHEGSFPKELGTRLPMIPPLGFLLAGVRRSRHAIAKTTPVSALAALLFLAAATFWLLFLGPLRSPHTTLSSGASTHGLGATSCDTTLGEWVRDPAGARPHYTNATCAFIQDYQNCMKHGRPSLDFLQWRWRPDGGPGCELPRFDAARFFRIVRGKSILFVGDSLASSHVTSLVCTLSEAEIPTRRSADGFEHWRFPAHDFAVSFFWTPFQMAEPEGGFYRAQLEEFRAAEEEARKNGVRLRLMDVTRIMLRRPDGHPDRYGHGAGDHGGFDIDCLHWCLPGPIDVWNELLLQIMSG